MRPCVATPVKGLYNYVQYVQLLMHQTETGQAAEDVQPSGQQGVQGLAGVEVCTCGMYATNSLKHGR